MMSAVTALVKRGRCVQDVLDLEVFQMHDGSQKGSLLYKNRRTHIGCLQCIQVERVIVVIVVIAVVTVIVVIVVIAVVLRWVKGPRRGKPAVFLGPHLPSGARLFASTPRCTSELDQQIQEQK